MHRAIRVLGDIPHRNARHFSQQAAVIEGDKRLSHGDVYTRITTLANGLHEVGVQPGDRVALLSRNNYRFIEIFFAIISTGGIFAPLNFWASHHELIHMLNLCAAEVLIISGEYLDSINKIRPQLKFLRTVVLFEGSPSPDTLDYDILLKHHNTSLTYVPEPGDDALILFTSGSTGPSKGAVYTHQALLYTAHAMNLEYGVRENDITLHFLPMFSSNLEHLIPLAYAGATHVVMRRFDPTEVWATIEREKITHFDAVPTLMRLLIQDAGREAYDTSSLRLVTYASEPMPPATVTTWLHQLPHVELVQFYGMIEFLCVTAQQPWAHHHKLGTVGKPHAGTDVRLVDESGHDVEAGEVGEVIARAPCGMRGYWNNPKATEAAVRDGWLYTGDLGRFDPDGFLALVGRKKDIIKSGGMSISAAEVENVLYEHPDVAEVAVFGVPADQYGEAVQAVVALKPGSTITEDDLIAFCRDQLAGYKCPRNMVFLHSLPKTGIGKIAKKVLRDSFMEKRDA